MQRFRSGATVWIFALVLVPSRPAPAQRVADFTPVGANVTVHAAPAPTGVTPSVALVRLRPVTRVASERALIQVPQPRRVWPRYALGGALVGAGTGALVAVRGCPAGSGCRDDGGLAWTPVAAGAYALVGAVVGGVMGTFVDAARRHRAANVPAVP